MAYSSKLYQCALAIPGRKLSLKSQFWLTNTPGNSHTWHDQEKGMLGSELASVWLVNACLWCLPQHSTPQRSTRHIWLKAPLHSASSIPSPSPLMWLWTQPKARRSSVSRKPNTLREHTHVKEFMEQRANGQWLNGQSWDNNILHPSNIHSQTERQKVFSNGLFRKTMTLGTLFQG